MSGPVWGRAIDRARVARDYAVLNRCRLVFWLERWLVESDGRIPRWVARRLVLRWLDDPVNRADLAGAIRAGVRDGFADLRRAAGQDEG